MSINIKTSTGLLEIGGQVTKEKVISALEYVPANKEVETTVENHISDTDVHITPDERTLWTNNVENLDSHKSDTTLHITSEERTAWNNKSDLTYVDTELDKKADKSELHEHSNKIILDGISSDDITNWNNKSDFSGSYSDLTDVPTDLATTTYVDTTVANLVNSAPEALNTLDELAAALGDDANFATTVANQIGLKANQTDLDNHTDDTVVHITSDERTLWNNKSEFSGDYNDLTNAPNIYEDGSQSVIFADESGNIIMKVDGDGFETTSVIAQSVVVNGTDVETTLNNLGELVGTQSVQTQISEAIANENLSQYATDSDLNNHTSNTTIHITSSERTSWNAKADLTYVDTELAKKSDSGHTHTVANISDLTVSVTELNYVDGVTSNVQTQIDNKANVNHTHDQYLVAEDIADKADKTELHEHSNKTVLDEISADRVSSWDNKSDFSGDYNDLENAPNIYEDGSDSLIIADQNGNIIFRSDANGFETTTLMAQAIVVNGIDVETTLNGKADISHSHTSDRVWYNEETSVTTVLDGLITDLTSKANQTQLDNYLPLTGGTITGDLSVNGSLTGEFYGYLDSGDADIDCGATIYTQNLNINSGQIEAYNLPYTYTLPEKSGTIALTDDYITAGAISGSTIGNYATAEGKDTTASGYASHAEGSGTTASAPSAHAEGWGTVASGDFSHAGGYYTIANDYQYVVGKYNTDTTAPTSLTDTTLSAGLLIVGIGSSDTARSNGFRVSASGKVYGTGTFGTSGADYAEYFEWFDGNPNNEDRRGRFVTLDGDKIRYATSNDDYILGVVSANPSVAGDIHSESWHDMYLKDIYGSKIVEVVEVEETINEKGEIIPAHTEQRWVLNPNYDPNTKYTSREERPEWAAIGIVGKLVVVDDGTCQVNGYCYPNVDGIVTASQEKTNYRVMERLDDTHIKIFIR